MYGIFRCISIVVRFAGGFTNQFDFKVSSNSFLFLSLRSTSTGSEYCLMMKMMKRKKKKKKLKKKNNKKKKR